MIRCIYLLSLLFFYSCQDSKPPSALEVEIAEIKTGLSIDQLKLKNFENFHIDWDSYLVYEPDCGTYEIIPKVDTSNTTYLLDFCLDRYIYADRYPKKSSEVSNIKFFDREISLYLNSSGNNRLDDIIRNKGDFYLFSDTITVFHPIHYFEINFLKNADSSKNVFLVDYGEIEKDSLLELVRSGMIVHNNDEVELLNKIHAQIYSKDTNSTAFFTDFTQAMVSDELVLRALIIDKLVAFFKKADSNDEVIISDLSFVFNGETKHLDECIKFRIMASH